MKYTIEQIKKMSPQQIREIEFTECKLCNSQDECEKMTITDCRETIINKF